MFRPFNPTPGGERLPQYPRVIVILQVAKVMLIPLVILAFFALNNKWVDPPWDKVIYIALPCIALPIIFVERALRKKYIAKIEADRIAAEEAQADSKGAGPGD